MLHGTFFGSQNSRPRIAVSRRSIKILLEHRNELGGRSYSSDRCGCLLGKGKRGVVNSKRGS